MAVDILRYQHAGTTRWGVVREGRVTAIPGDHRSTGDLIRSVTPAELVGLDGPTVDAAEVTLLSPVTSDQQFLCQGANYRQHMVESGIDPDDKTFNMMFTKAPSCIVPADAAVVRPRGVRLLDYEIELGLVLRRDLDALVDVTAGDLGDFVAGLVIVNDYSARDVQIPQMQFYKGKSFRTFGPVGPHLCLLEPEDVALIGELELELRVNGVVRQRDSTANLVYGPAETLTELSGVHDLRAGDLLATGTPAGCALRVPPPWKQRLAGLLPERRKWSMFLASQEALPTYLQPGDQVEARIWHRGGRLDLGVQRNTITAEAEP